MPICWIVRVLCQFPIVCSRMSTPYSIQNCRPAYSNPPGQSATISMSQATTHDETKVREHTKDSKMKFRRIPVQRPVPKWVLVLKTEVVSKGSGANVATSNLQWSNFYEARRTSRAKWRRESEDFNSINPVQKGDQGRGRTRWSVAGLRLKARPP